MTDLFAFGRFLAPLLAVSLLAGCHGSGGGATGDVVPGATQSPGAASAYQCPQSPQAVASSARAQVAGVERMRPPPIAADDSIDGLVAVRLKSGLTITDAAAVTPAEAAAGANAVVKQFDYAAIASTTRVLRVDRNHVSDALARLRAMPGVVAVSRVAVRRTLVVDQRYLTDDPYFRGFPPARAPYFETASIAGMWDMHAIGLDYAWEYGQSGNGSSVYQPLALGAYSVKVAILDTGEDVAHPELSNGKIVYTKCFVTSPGGASTSSIYVTDRDGHGTAVSGMAAAKIDNQLGFVGAGGDVSLMGYRVFPTPDDNCLRPGNHDRQCAASTVDIASAIDDAVNNGARVINLSLGGGPCPDDQVEGTAIANAVAHNVIVVAASGNNGRNSVDAPACDPGVIAVGASALADGHRNGSGAGGSGEYVASYSNYAANRPTSWGLVAPGGDPYCPGTNACGDRDYLHWVYNIVTTTPLDAKFAGLCQPDEGNPGGPVDCRILLAGTSASSPHVAGVAALILSVNSATYGTPSAMLHLLCSTAQRLRSARQGCGRLDAYRALAVALGDPNPPR